MARPCPPVYLQDLAKIAGSSPVLVDFLEEINMF